MYNPLFKEEVTTMAFIICAFILIAADQISKFAAIKFLKPHETIEIIKGVLSFTYVENRGAAFGILQNARWVFILFTIFAMGIMVFYKIKNKPQGKIINTSLCLLLAGATGNMIDRLCLGYVVDMIEVTFIDYPVFNVADCFVVVGTILLAYYILFIYKEPKKVDDNGQNL